MFTDGLRTHSAALAQCTPLLIATPGSQVVIVSAVIPEAKRHGYVAAIAMAKAAEDRRALAAAGRNCGSTGSPRPRCTRLRSYRGVMQYADRMDLTGSQSPEQVGRAIAAVADDSDLSNLTRRALSIDARAQPYRVDVWS
jgi:dehydrogenase/reductase SDR family member 1